MITFDEFQAEWLGKRVDYDHVYGFQCVDLIRQGFYEMYNLPGGGGVPSAITYWQATPDEVLQKFVRTPNSDAQKGDVVILWGLPGNADGHIGWATGNDTATTVEILEQNGSTGNGSGLASDAIRTRYVDRSRVAGLLRPIAVPAPARTPKDYMQYTAVPTKTMRTNKVNTNWWNLSNDSRDINNFQPAAILTIQSSFTIGGYAKNLHFPDFTYAMTPDDFQRAVNDDFSTNNGINLNDLDELPPAPYVPPAPPVTVEPAEKYEVFVQLDGFKTALDATKQENFYQPVAPGTNYFVYSRDLGMINISTDNMKSGVWINPKYNVFPAPASPSLPVDLPPAVTTPVDVVTLPVLAEQGSLDSITRPNTWKVTTALKADNSAVLFDAINPSPLPIRDLEMKQGSITMPPYNEHKPVPIVSTFVKDGVTYGRTPKVAKNFWYYGIPMDYLRPHQESFLEEVEDNVLHWTDWIETAQKRAYTLITDISPVARQKVTYQAKQFIDGFKKGTKR